MPGRGDKRIYFRPPINAAIKSKEQSDDVVITDISRSGLRFNSKAQYKEGDRLHFELQSDDMRDLPHSIKATVVNKYGNVQDGKFAYGVRFHRIAYWYERNRIHDFVYSRKDSDS